MTSDSVLIHFCLDILTEPQTDASGIGLEAVLCQLTVSNKLGVVIKQVLIIQLLNWNVWL